MATAEEVNAPARTQTQEWVEKRCRNGLMADPAAVNPASEAAFRERTTTLGHPELLDDFRALVKSAGLTKAPLLLLGQKEVRPGRTPKKPGARATKLIGGEYIIVVDQELLKQNSASVIRGVMGHELAHIQLGHLDRKASWIEKICTKVFGEPGLIALWKSRRREIQSDLRGAVIAGGVEDLTKYFSDRIRERKEKRRGLAARLKNSAIMQRCSGWFGTHPAHDTRVKKMKSFAVRHSAELQAGKSRLEEARRKVKQDFAEAAVRAVVEKPAAAPPPQFGPAI